MHSNNSIHRAVRATRSAQLKSNPRTGHYMEIGSWRFEENEDGDLVIVNLETKKVVTLIQK